MDLPNLLNHITKPQQESKQYLAIEIGLDVVKTALWQSDGKHTEVVSTGSIQSWSAADDEELFTAIDTSLADALGSIEHEPNQVIFGLPDAWVQADGILVDTKKALLRTICKKFNFQAIGFVITTVAISHYIRDIEGGASSYILVQLASAQLVVCLIVNGQLESAQLVDRSTNLSIDIEEALAKLSIGDNLPSRIIFMANQDDSETINQELTAHEWQKHLPFLHLPKIESMPKEISIKAVSISGGAEVIQSLAPKVIPPSPPETKPVDLGFKPVSLGTENLVQQTHQPAPPPIPEPEPITTADNDNLEPATLEPVKPASPIRKISLPKIKLPSLSKKLILPIAIAVGLIGVILGGFFAYRRFPSASIDISIAMSPYQQQINFVIDPSIQASDLESGILAGITNSVDVTGSKTIPTTGTKLVGDRAKGKIIIYNRTTAEKTFKAGTAIKANSLKFTLDTNVTVASASSKENADFSVTIEPSKIEANITAADIGSQYNLAKSTQFVIENFSNDTFFAIADTAMAGGSSQTVAAVSADDISNLKTELIKELQQQLLNQTASDSAASVGQISVGEPKINDEDYSATKNEEASELTLTLSLSQTVYQYDAGELSVIAQTLASKSLPETSQVRPDSTKVNLLSSTVNEQSQAEVSAQVVLYHIPRIETGDISTLLVNTKFDQIGSKLAALPGYQQHQLTQSKFLFPNYLPPTPSQIKIRILPITKD